MIEYKLYKRLSEILNKETENSKSLVLKYDEEFKSGSETFIVPVITKAEYNEFLSLIENISSEEYFDYEVIKVEYENVSSDDILNHRLVPVDAGEYISSTNFAKGNRYRSDCDTYGPHYFSKYLLFIEELDSFLIYDEYSIAC